MRLRSTLLAAVLAGSLALAGCGEQPSGSEPSAAGSEPTQDSTATTIPDDFPLAAGMGGSQDKIPTSRTGTGLRDLELCGTTPLRGLGLRDRMVVDNSGGESADTRELVLLGHPDEAVQVAQAFADLAEGCDAPDVTGDMETITELRESPFGAAPAGTLVQTYTFDGEPGEGHTILHVIPVGAALLVSSTYGQNPDELLEQDVDRTVASLRETVAALAMFADGTPTPTPSITPVPADFPLGVGLPEDDGETTVAPPSADGDGMGVVEMCGREVWPLGQTTGGTVRLVTSALGPEYFDGRELLVHADAAAAEESMAVFRAAAQECRHHDNRVWTVLHRDTGYDTVTVGLTYDDGLGSSVFQVTRVGTARLMVQTYGEGSLASLDEQADGVTATTGTIVPAMCVFTKTGC
jgi:hypothetical protein